MAKELQRFVHDDIPGVDSDDDDDTAARDGNGDDPIINGFGHHVLKKQKQPVWNVTRNCNQGLRMDAHTEHDPRAIVMLFSPGIVPEPEQYTPRRFSRHAKKQTCGN